MAEPSFQRPRDSGFATHHCGRNRWSLLLLLIPFVALLYPPFYSSIQPDLAGIPYFIWYQLAWVLLGALIVGLVHRLHD